MADTNTTLEIMLFEGGALIDALSDKQQGEALATKIESADRDAFGNGKISFSLDLDPIEVGMAINALTGNQSPLSQSLGQKLQAALGEKLQELGITTGGNGGGLGDGSDASTPAQGNGGLSDSTPSDTAPTPDDAPLGGDDETSTDSDD